MLCWTERGRDAVAPATWRYSLEDPHTGERRGFADLAALVAHLEAETAGTAAPAAGG
jgi:hypothetical protein